MNLRGIDTVQLNVSGSPYLIPIEAARFIAYNEGTALRGDR